MVSEFSPQKLGKDYHFDSCVSTGLVQPVTSWGSTRRWFFLFNNHGCCNPIRCWKPIAKRPDSEFLCSSFGQVAGQWRPARHPANVMEYCRTNQPTNPSISQPIHQSVNQSINRSISQSISESVNQSVNSRVNLYIYQFQQFSNRHCNITILFSGKCSQNKTAKEDAPKANQQQLPNFLKGTTTSTEISAMIRQTRWIFHDTSRCWDCFFK